jgi:hypothetical protein
LKQESYAFLSDPLAIAEARHVIVKPQSLAPSRAQRISRSPLFQTPRIGLPFQRTPFAMPDRSPTSGSVPTVDTIGTHEDRG